MRDTQPADLARVSLGGLEVALGQPQPRPGVEDAGVPAAGMRAGCETGRHDLVRLAERAALDERLDEHRDRGCRHHAGIPDQLERGAGVALGVGDPADPEGELGGMPLHGGAQRHRATPERRLTQPRDRSFALLDVVGQGQHAHGHVEAGPFAAAVQQRVVGDRLLRQRGARVGARQAGLRPEPGLVCAHAGAQYGAVDGARRDRSHALRALFVALRVHQQRIQPGELDREPGLGIRLRRGRGAEHLVERRVLRVDHLQCRQPREDLDPRPAARTLVDRLAQPVPRVRQAGVERSSRERRQQRGPVVARSALEQRPREVDDSHVVCALLGGLRRRLAQDGGGAGVSGGTALEEVTSGGRG